MDWIAYGEEKKIKVTYSQEVVDLLDKGGARFAGRRIGTAGVADLLAAYAGREDGLIGQLKGQHAISSAQWRAAVANLANGSRESVHLMPSMKPGLGPMREYLTPEEVAEILAIHAQTVRGLVRSGKLPGLRLAGERAIRIRHADLEKFLEPAVQAD